jgi:hypothetical protein
MAASAYTASFDGAGNFVKKLHDSQKDANIDGKLRAAGVHFQAKAVGFDGQRRVFTSSVLAPSHYKSNITEATDDDDA